MAFMIILHSEQQSSTAFSSIFFVISGCSLLPIIIFLFVKWQLLHLLHKNHVFLIVYHKMEVFQTFFMFPRTKITLEGMSQFPQVMFSLWLSPTMLMRETNVTYQHECKTADNKRKCGHFDFWLIKKIWLKKTNKQTKKNLVTVLFALEYRDVTGCFKNTKFLFVVKYKIIIKIQRQGNFIEWTFPEFIGKWMRLKKDIQSRLIQQQEITIQKTTGYGHQQV